MNANANDVKPASVPVAYPSTGALLGSLVGAFAASKLGFNPADPTTGGAITAGIAGLVAALFNQLGKWLHIG